MKAYIIKDTNDKNIDDIQLADISRPVPKDDEVLIEVHAVGLNPVDFKIVESGVDSWTYPHTLGLDVAGVITAIGKNVKNWQVGMRVSGHSDLTKDGCFSEFITVPAYQLAQIPDNISFETAASLLCGALTAYQAVNRKPNLTNVKTALVHAGAGGVGSLAIQFLQLHGIKVFTTVSTQKVNFVKQLHPDKIIDYRTENVTDKIMKFTDNFGVDLIIDTVGKSEAEADLKRLAYNGQLVTIVDVPNLDAEYMFKHALSLDVVNLGGAHLSHNPLQQKDLGIMNREVLQLASAGSINPLIEKVLSFEQLCQGLKMLKNHEVTGKLVVKVK